jgi:hypothetical protein
MSDLGEFASGEAIPIGSLSSNWSQGRSMLVIEATSDLN